MREIGARADRNDHRSFMGPRPVARALPLVCSSAWDRLDIPVNLCTEVIASKAMDVNLLIKLDQYVSSVLG